MKTKIFLLAFFAILMTTNTSAQDDCTIAVSLFTEPAKIKNYEGALPHYDKVITSCPQYSVAVYQYAVKMFEYFIEQGDQAKIKDLENAYQLRMKYFPKKSKKGDIMADIAQIKYDNGIGDKLSQYNAFDLAYKTDEPNFKSPKAIYTYFSLVMDLYKDGQKDIQEVFDLYDIIIEKIEKEEGNYAVQINKMIEKEEAGQKLSSKDQKKLDG
ncbi:MAG TPA: hypothetical protein DHV98_05395, partial [Flavobacteriaceae bacterium]|nr:hypothetical protein [Flavobacteriaceae bacterium]